MKELLEVLTNEDASLQAALAAIDLIAEDDTNELAQVLAKILKEAVL